MTQNYKFYHRDHRPWYKNSRIWKRIFVYGLGVPMVLAGVIIGISHYQRSEVTATANRAMEDVKKQSGVKIDTQKAKSKKYEYGTVSNIPSNEQLTQLLKQPIDSSMWGYAAAPSQEGLSAPIQALPIHEGSNDVVLANGWGTVVAGYQMSKGNNILAAHNFADKRTYASPLQDIDVSKSPKFYQTNGKQVFEYELKTRDRVYYEGEHVSKILAPSKKPMITLITCDEPTLFPDLYTKYRVIVTGELVHTQDLETAPDNIKNLFPKF